MKASDHFLKLIELYRQLNRPALENTKFQASVNFSPEVIGLLQNLWECKKYNINLTVDGNDYSIEMDDKLPNLTNGQTACIEVTVPLNDQGFFYKNAENWIESAKSLKKGRIASNTYLIDEDVLVDEESTSQKVYLVKRICDLIGLLSEIAHYHDEKHSFSDSYRLVFVVPDKDNKIYHPVVLETQLTADVLNVDLPDISMLSAVLKENSTANSIHASERVSVFRVALAEAIEKIPHNTKAFPYLVDHWTDVIEGFNKSWDRYLSGFSFNKLMAEMAEQQASVSQKLSDIVASLSGRLFSLPIAVYGIVVVEKAESSLANWFYLLSSLLVSYMVYSSVSIQRVNLDNAKSSYEMSFSEFQNKMDEKNSVILGELQKVIYRLNTTFLQLSCKLRFYAWIAWVPLLVAIFYILLKSDMALFE